MSRIVRPEEGLDAAPFTEPTFAVAARKIQLDADLTAAAPALGREPTAEELRAGAQREADALLARAREEAQRLRAEAEQAGRATGEAAGREEGRRTYQAQADALAAVAVELRHETARLREALLPHVVELVLAVVERLLGDALAADPTRMAHVVGEALSVLSKREAVTVRVHPDLVDAVREERGALLEAFEGVERFTVVGDESVTPGGCILDTESVSIDATVEQALRKLREGLLDLGGEADQS